MRIGIISDIHSNLPALHAVLDDVGRQDPDEVWCLGDIVGYGAQPDECASLVSQMVERCLAGNHDLVVRGDIDLDYFAMSAGAAARWTVKVINDDTREFLRPLSPLGQRAGIGLFHASPRDPVWEYVLSVRQASDCLDAQSQRICLIGHSHVACYFTRSNGSGTTGETIGELAPSGTKLALAEGKWLVNPGSVGQPRDGDPRAAYGILDTDKRTLWLQRVDYDVQAAQAKILAAGLPDVLAQRLAVGR